MTSLDDISFEALLDMQCQQALEKLLKEKDKNVQKQQKDVGVGLKSLKPNSFFHKEFSNFFEEAAGKDETQIQEKIIEEENNEDLSQEESTEEEDTSQPKIDIKLLLYPQVCTTKLEHMGLFDHNTIGSVNDKYLIELINFKSNPVKNKDLNFISSNYDVASSIEISDDEHDNGDSDDGGIKVQNVVKRDSNVIEDKGIIDNRNSVGDHGSEGSNDNIFISDDSDVEFIQDPITDSQRVDISNNLFNKPLFRNYNRYNLIHNPDFNITLKGLSPSFFSYRNIILLEQCKPLTIDVSKAFESKLVNNTVYLKGKETDLKNRVTDSFNTIDLEVIKDTAVSTQRNKLINLPTMTDVRRINQRLLTASVPPIKVNEDTTTANLIVTSGNQSLKSIPKNKLETPRSSSNPTSSFTSTMRVYCAQNKIKNNIQDSRRSLVPSSVESTSHVYSSQSVQNNVLNYDPTRKLKLPENYKSNGQHRVVTILNNENTESHYSANTNKLDIGQPKNISQGFPVSACTCYDEQIFNQQGQLTKYVQFKCAFHCRLQSDHEKYSEYQPAQNKDYHSNHRTHSTGDAPLKYASRVTINRKPVKLYRKIVPLSMSTAVQPKQINSHMVLSDGVISLQYSSAIGSDSNSMINNCDNTQVLTDRTAIENTQEGIAISTISERIAADSSENSCNYRSLDQVGATNHNKSVFYKLDLENATLTPFKTDVANEMVRTMPKLVPISQAEPVKGFNSAMGSPSQRILPTPITSRININKEEVPLIIIPADNQLIQKVDQNRTPTSLKVRDQDHPQVISPVFMNQLDLVTNQPSNGQPIKRPFNVTRMQQKPPGQIVNMNKQDLASKQPHKNKLIRIIDNQIILNQNGVDRSIATMSAISKPVAMSSNMIEAVPENDIKLTVENLTSTCGTDIIENSIEGEGLIVGENVTLGSMGMDIQLEFIDEFDNTNNAVGPNKRKSTAVVSNRNKVFVKKRKHQEKSDDVTSQADGESSSSWVLYGI